MKVKRLFQVYWCEICEKYWLMEIANAKELDRRLICPMCENDFLYYSDIVEVDIR